MPRYHLPLELELHILELATPPLLMDHLAKRVDFLLIAALVHRSITPWAQQRLRDQLIYTFRDRVGEQKRLKERLAAGFGSPSSARLTRLYLDLHEWTQDRVPKIKFLGEGDDDSDWKGDGASPVSAPQESVQAATEATPAVVGPLPFQSRSDLYNVIQPWLARLAMVWVLLEPFVEDPALVDPHRWFTGACYMELDDHWFRMMHTSWAGIAAVLPATLRTLVLRGVECEAEFPTFPSLKRLVLIDCYFYLGSQNPDVATIFPNLKRLTSIDYMPVSLRLLAVLSVAARSAIFYTSYGHIFDAQAVATTGMIPMSSGRLESCTFAQLLATPLRGETPPSFDDDEAFASRLFTNSNCTVRCHCLDATIEETVDRVLADLVI